MCKSNWTKFLGLFVAVCFICLGTIVGCDDDDGGGGGGDGGGGVGAPPPATPTPTPTPLPGGGVQPGAIPQKILALRPLRGMAYAPSPSDFTTTCHDPNSCKYFDSDFANDDFKGLWSSENPGGTGQGRADLESMAMNLDVNFVRLYDWSGPDFRHHINFLNEANGHGIKVAVPISNFTLQCIRGDQDCVFNGVPGITFAKNNIKSILGELITNGKPHEAIAMWTIGNEFDINNFHPDVVATAIQFLIEAEEELGVTDDANKLPITVPISLRAFCCSDDSKNIDTCRLPLAGCDLVNNNCGQVAGGSL